MGFFDRWFRRDPEATLATAEELLERGNLLRARQLAEGLQASHGGSVRERAQTITRKARRAMLESTLENATLAEEQGQLVEAGDWLRSALEHAIGTDREDAVREQLARVARKQAAAPEFVLEPEIPSAHDPGDPHGDGFDADTLFATWVDSLAPQAAQRYAHRESAFREAVVDVNEGNPEAALEAFNALIEETPGDPILHFERGRARLVAGEPLAAREDFEIAWEGLGSETLDRADELSVPRLWAEASLEAGEPEAMVERFSDPLLEEPTAGGAVIAELFGFALLNTERYADAQRVLTAAAHHFPRVQAFPYLLARAHEALGQPDDAIDCLEVAIAPSCASGNCSRPPLHLPSLRALARLQLQQEPPNIERAGELLTFLSAAKQGQLGESDLRLVARYEEAAGNPEAAKKAISAAEYVAAQTAIDDEI
ncbi:MAG: tetratricopeptide repeat protein [Acidobacteriota bacterium]